MVRYRGPHGPLLGIGRPFGYESYDHSFLAENTKLLEQMKGAHFELQ